MLDLMTHAKAQSRKGDRVHENDIAKQVVDVAFQLHTKLGPGLLESVYQKIMAHELRKRGSLVENGSTDTDPLG